MNFLRYFIWIMFFLRLFPSSFLNIYFLNPGHATVAEKSWRHGREEREKNLFLQISYNEKQMLFYANDVTHVPQHHNSESFFSPSRVASNAKSKLNMLNLCA